MSDTGRNVTPETTVATPAMTYPYHIAEYVHVCCEHVDEWKRIADMLAEALLLLMDIYNIDSFAEWSDDETQAAWKPMLEAKAEFDKARGEG